MSKQCFKCQVVKPLTQFYKHFGMADGHLNKCKACAKRDVLEHRTKNIETVREYDRRRARQPHRIIMSSEVTRLWRRQDKRRVKCHNAVARAIRSGNLERLPCQRCGDLKSLAHHEDYDKPLEVIWLCQPCHKERHKELRTIPF